MKKRRANFHLKLIVSNRPSWDETSREIRVLTDHLQLFIMYYLYN